MPPICLTFPKLPFYFPPSNMPSLNFNLITASKIALPKVIEFLMEADKSKGLVRLKVIKQYEIKKKRKPLAS